MASTCESIDEALAVQLKLIDDFKFDEAEMLMARIKTLRAVTEAQLARVKSAEASLLFARATAHMAVDTESGIDAASIYIETAVGQEVLRLALEACDIAATPTDETPTDETPTDETPTDETPAAAPLERLELLLIQLSSMLIAVQAATALEASSHAEIGSTAAPLFSRALQLCRTYTSEYMAAKLDLVRWDDPWTPFVKLLFYRAIESQNASAIPDAEFAAAAIEAKRAALAAIAAGSQTQELALLDLHIMHCFVLQRSLLMSYRPDLADQLRAVVAEGLAQISSSAARNQPAYLKAKSELEEFLAVTRP
jgi:hypothetical protein